MLVNIIGKELDLFRSLGVCDLSCFNDVGLQGTMEERIRLPMKKEIDRLDSEIGKAKKNLDMAG